MSVTDSSLASGSATAGSRLLGVIQAKGFTPTLEFEKKLTESFLKKLQQCVENNLTDLSTIVLQDFIMCVLAVSEIDNKFVQYHFAKTNSTVYLLVSILRKHSFYSDCHGRLLTLRVLQLIKEIVLQIPLMRISFVNDGLHQALIYKSDAQLSIDLITLCFDILNALTDTDCQRTLKEVLSVSCLDWTLYVIENWLKLAPNLQQSSDQLLLIALDFVSKIANNGPLSNANHMRKFDIVFVNLSKTLPQHKRLFQDIHTQLAAATSFTVGKPGVNKPIPLSSQTVRRQYSKPTILPFEMSFKDLKINDNKLCLMSRKPLSENFQNRQFVFVRYSFVAVMDPSTNVLFPEHKIKDISLNNTAEIICGMLNSNKGGHIHIGINSSGQIEGVRINFNERDGFRSGIDNLFHHKITPMIPSSMIDVQFIPVKDELKALNSDHLLFVIRVSLPANTNTVYYLKNDTSCYLYGPQGNSKLNLREVRRLAVTFTEQRLFLKYQQN